MKTVAIVIDRDRCKGCELCIAFCPENVLALSSGDFNALGYRPATVVHPEACTGCTHCARMCPEAAITITVTQKAAPAGVAAT
ncbi:MAG: 4Fe-4S binding protein [Bacillota bacterium]